MNELMKRDLELIKKDIIRQGAEIGKKELIEEVLEVLEMFRYSMDGDEFNDMFFKVKELV